MSNREPVTLAVFESHDRGYFFLEFQYCTRDMMPKVGDILKLGDGDNIVTEKKWEIPQEKIFGINYGYSIYTDSIYELTERNI